MALFCLQTFLRTLSLKADVGSDDTRNLEAWADAVSTFIAASGNVGWGSRTGGVVVAGETTEICGVTFEGNALQLGQQKDTTVTFEPNAAMVAGGGAECKEQLKTAVTGGWHQGQAFYYRLSVDRPGRYTVRLTVIFYHNDKRRGDG
ncbi:unnamed protein product, partial [Laminaria digitata]